MTSTNNNIHFIITAKPPPPNGYINPGAICFIDKQRLDSRQKRNDTNPLPVIVMGGSCDSYIDTAILKPLNIKEAALLMALESDKERLLSLEDPKILEEACKLTDECKVYVESCGEKLKGVIRYIGRTARYRANPLTGTFFGVELQEDDREKGQNNGSLNGNTYFKCPKNTGVFATFTKITLRDHTPLAPPLESQSSLSKTTVHVGDRVVCFGDTNDHHGMVIEIRHYHHGQTVLISTDTYEEILVSMDCVIKEEMLSHGEAEKMDTSQSPEAASTTDSEAFSVGSLVQYLDKKLGIIRWIGYFPGFKEKIAGLEVEAGTGVNDGTFKGQRYFDCPPQNGLFVKLSTCRPEDYVPAADEKEHNGHSDPDGASMEVEIVPPFITEDVTKQLIGQKKGIQGHCNSCYMDSALFSVFSCSSVLDCLLFKSTQQAEKKVQDILLNNIVNPLRKKGFVSAHSVMDLRKLLQQHEHCPTYTTDEKDPEEFLSLLMQKVLSLDPLLNICQSSNRQKVQSCFYYQIFMDYNHHLVLPTVQQLLEHSFYSCDIKLAEVPACLILTMPRSGKRFKMFPKIIPSVELDITGLLAEGPQECVLCGQLANEECFECFRDSAFSDTGFKYFCSRCSSQVHSHQQRGNHKKISLDLPGHFIYQDTLRPPLEKLELFAVLCIETSHYVSFVKYGPQDTDWIFFDSMADRVGEVNGYNIPEVRACPEVSQYLHMPLAQLANQVPREMEGVAKRLFCDGYMYLYQSKSMCLYR